MKTKKHYILICVILFFTGCDKDFVDVNTNRYFVTSVDPALLLAGAEQGSYLGVWGSEQTIAQQFLSPYNSGATVGLNFNIDVDANTNGNWNQSYTGPVKNLTQALRVLGPQTTRVNLQSMVRIWKAQVFMALVDEYGDIPYFDAGQAFPEGKFYPKYDDDAAIYADLYSEIKAGVAALDPAADFVKEDLFYGINAQPSTKTGNAADQVVKWKKLGNSLLLRLGMRYSKVDPAKAQSIVAEAFAGGVMTSNADNAFIKYDGTLYSETANLNLRNFSAFNYVGEPFVNQLKSTNDPRGRSIFANYTDPGTVTQPNPDVTLANMYGAPVGVISTVIEAGTPYRGKRGTGLNYSQVNTGTVGSPAAPDFFVTYAQTSLLLAEAAKRGWIAGGDASAQTYYENGIKADMDVYSLYPGTTPITDAEKNAYLADPGVIYDPANALKLINTQYWIVNLRNGIEVFANFRRSGYPTLSPNLYNSNLNGGFVRRFTYPDAEASANLANYQTVSSTIGGDNLLTRVFWDVP